jgi:mono/diheme cytochrome c family protein
MLMNPDRGALPSGTRPDGHVETHATNFRFADVRHRAGVLVGILVLTTAALLPAAHAETSIERGAYLMRSIVACGNCHTAKGPDGELPGMELAGWNGLERNPAFDANTPNITPDRETGIGAWTDAQIVAAIREGKRPDGTIIGPPMPISLYRGLSDTDVNAIVAYLRSIPAVRNAVPKSVYRIPLRPTYGPPVSSVPDVPRADRVAYGAYLAGPAGHCLECHSPMGPHGPDWMHQPGAGGIEFQGPWGVSIAPNITPTGLADRSAADIKRQITTGMRADGSKMMPPMAYPYYAKIRDEDLDAIIAFLRVLPPR